MICTYCRRVRQTRNFPLTFGVREDCENLLYQFLIHPQLDFENFCELWHASQFNSVLHGQSSLEETLELTEETLRIVKSYLSRSAAAHVQRVAAVFLLYAVYSTQPLKNFAKVWVTPRDVFYLKLLEREARRLKQHEVLYVLASMFAVGAFQYSATDRDHGLEKKAIKYFNSCEAECDLSEGKGGCLSNQCEAVIIMREARELLAAYTQFKKRLQYKYTDRSLRFVNENFADEICDSLIKIATNPETEEPLEHERQNNLRHFPLCQRVFE